MSKTTEAAKRAWTDVRQVLESLPVTPILFAAGGTLLTVGILGALLSSSPPPPEIRR